MHRYAQTVWGAHAAAADKALTVQSGEADKDAVIVQKAMLDAAGVAALFGSPYGFIVAGGLALGAAAIQLVRLISQGKMRQDQVVAYAKRMGVPDAAEVPAFTVRVMRMSPKERLTVGDNLQKQLQHAHGQAADKIKSRLTVLGAAHVLDMAQKRGKAPASVPAPIIAAQMGDTPTVADPTLASVGADNPPWALYAGVTAAAAGGLYLLYKMTR